VDKTNSDFYPGNQFVAGQFVDPDYLGNLQFKNASLFTETNDPTEYLSGNYHAKENVFAGFVEMKQNFTEKFSANFGLRVEHTNNNYTGNIVENEIDFKGISSLKNNYTDILPNVNLKYKVTNNFVLKAACTRSIARPKYFDLVPYFNINSNDLELAVGNTQLNPARSFNLDIIAENYYRSVGVISYGLFFKRIDKFVYTYIDNNYTREKFAADFLAVNNPIAPGDTWTFSQRRNGNGGTVWGIEAAIQRQFDFLQGLWKGFGIYLNYTYTHSKAKGIYDASGAVLRQGVKVPGAAPHIFNASLSYENKKMVARLSANFTSSYVDDRKDEGYSFEVFYDRYRGKQFFLDANASYAITERLRIFGEAHNLTNQPLTYYQGITARIAQLEYYGPHYNMGMKFDLIK
jgi:TonB-dependent receptor